MKSDTWTTEKPTQKMTDQEKIEKLEILVRMLLE